MSFSKFLAIFICTATSLLGEAAIHLSLSSGVPLSGNIEKVEAKFAIKKTSIQDEEIAPETSKPAKKKHSVAPSIPYKSIVIINTDGGTGTGFLVTMKGRNFLATNIHVVAGAKFISCKTADGQQVDLPETFFIAKDRDLAIFPVVHQGAYLEINDNLSEQIRIGDYMTVFGNEAGASVITECTGQVKGIGPLRIETDAKFVEGNSGSPALHHDSGKVIGIAAYYIEYKIPEADRSETNGSQASSPYRQADSPQETVRRRFAERLDNVTAWEQSTLDGLETEADALTQYNNYIQSIVKVAIGISKEKRVLKASEAPEEVRRPLEEFHSRFSNTRSAGSDGNRRALSELKREMLAIMDTYYRNASRSIKSSYYIGELERSRTYAESVSEYISGVYSY